MRAVLERLESSDHGTFGRLTMPGLSLFTGELPDRGNAPSISRIPAGIYPVRWTWSPRFKRFMYLVDEVPDRTGVRFHSANLMGDASLGFRCQLNGCIAPGERLGWMDGQKAVLLSAPAVRRFETLMNGKPFELEIRDARVP